jgi:16S rRNA (cytidine1402-2'-O)-methyltransferase
MLYIVATPIGNLEDITLRALRTLKEVDYILCEDTRVAKKMLNHFEITTPLISYHQHSNDEKIKSIIDLLRLGNTLALITDAGTPGISDPGGKLIAEILKLKDDAQIIPIPGASALTAALSISGMPTDRFSFFGFLPHKKGRQTMLREISESPTPVVVFESKHRILKLLKEIGELMPNAELMAGRELTKLYETTYRGTAAEINSQINSNAVEQKGEFVVVINNKKYGK